MDEADTIFGGKNADANEDLRGLLNAGHQRNRPAIRWDAGTRSLETIPTFAMAALAGIGAMPDTIEDRAVVIRCAAAPPGKQSRRSGTAGTGPRSLLAGQLAGWLGRTWTSSNGEPDMPRGRPRRRHLGTARRVADLAGGGWPGRARDAASG